MKLFINTDDAKNEIYRSEIWLRCFALEETSTTLHIFAFFMVVSCQGISYLNLFVIVLIRTLCICEYVNRFKPVVATVTPVLYESRALSCISLSCRQSLFPRLWWRFTANNTTCSFAPHGHWNTRYFRVCYAIHIVGSKTENFKVLYPFAYVMCNKVTTAGIQQLSARYH